ncbi:hypothetical protein SEA_MARSHAWN_71 [Mycobacterium phage Marshawn]|uniref:Uncharacterized protein n=1 Tax=Mycobacterium phage Marshawn TaxID=2652423 RepID=A0A5P8D753_9CAUD|nr:hypothetical protein I5H02_gp28 [Mycobacterium phage Marshawn]QFP94857.1 hypothetical protein SEA_MARSHAWN_71 [Mycobacterium phage Marshawn]
MPTSDTVSDTSSSPAVLENAGTAAEGLPVPTGRCLHCSREADSFLFVCWNCAKTLSRQLNEVPWLLRRLHESAYGEANVARKGGPRVSQGECLPSLPLNGRAADLLRDADRLASMAEQLAGYRLPFLGTPTAAEQAARYLATLPGQVMFYPYAADALRWVLQWVADATTAIDLPPDLQYAGPCQTPRTEDVIEGGVVIRTLLVGQCGAPLYVDTRLADVECWRCGTSWRVDDLQRQALARVDDRPRTAADMWRLFKFLGRDVPRSTFYRMMTAVEAHGYDPAGLPVYTHSSVVAALDARDAAEAARLAAGKAKRGRPRKAAAVDVPTRVDGQTAAVLRSAASDSVTG